MGPVIFFSFVPQSPVFWSATCTAATAAAPSATVEDFAAALPAASTDAPSISLVLSLVVARSSP